MNIREHARKHRWPEMIKKQRGKYVIDY
jgi:hypothetical protein